MVFYDESELKSWQKIKEGTNLLRLGHHIEAINLFEEVFSLNPRNSRFRIAAAMQLLSHRLFEPAFDTLYVLIEKEISLDAETKKNLHIMMQNRQKEILLERTTRSGGYDPKANRVLFQEMIVLHLIVRMIGEDKISQSSNRSDIEKIIGSDWLERYDKAYGRPDESTDLIDTVLNTVKLAMHLNPEDPEVTQMKDWFDLQSDLWSNGGITTQEYKESVKKYQNFIEKKKESNNSHKQENIELIESYGGVTLIPTEATSLQILENQIGKSIPKVSKITIQGTFGFMTRNDHVIGLGMCKQKLRGLPETLGQLTNLQTLNLWQNKLTSLPESLGQMKNLKKLYLGWNKFESLPETIGKLVNLTCLNLMDNQLLFLPETLRQLTKLQTLSLYNNKLTSLPEWLGQLTNLQLLTLSSNKFTFLPETLGQLTKLQELTSNNNRLVSLPESLGQMKSLQNLVLSHNQLTSLPKTLGQLTNLQTLNLQDNKLTSLPETIGQLKNLKNLYLYDNPLKTLPESLSSIPTLEKFYITKSTFENLTLTPQMENWFTKFTKSLIKIGRHNWAKEDYLTFTPNGGISTEDYRESINKKKEVQKYCLYCSDKLTEEDTVCPNCGKELH